MQDIARDAAHILGSGLQAEESGAAAAHDALAAHRPALALAFSMYASFGLRDEAASSTPELDSFRCAKLAREAGLLDSGLTAQALDVLFAAAKERGARRWGGRGVRAGLRMAGQGLAAAASHGLRLPTDTDRWGQVGTARRPGWMPA